VSTFLELAQRLHRESLRSGTGPVSIVSATGEQQRLFDAINDAWLETQMLPRRWKWMRRTMDAALDTVNTEYDAATDLLLTDFGWWRPKAKDYTVRAYDPTNATAVWGLLWVDYDDYVRMFLDSPPAAAAPQAWSISPTDGMCVGPLPNIVYNLKADYQSEPVELVDDADEPDMPARHHRVLVWRALMEVAKIDAAPELLARAAANYEVTFDALLVDQADSMMIEAMPLA
jgi:hypothetical protein